MIVYQEARLYPVMWKLKMTGKIATLLSLSLSRRRQADQRMGLKTAKHKTTWMIMGHWFAANNELYSTSTFSAKLEKCFTVDRDSLKRQNRNLTEPL